MTETVEVFGGGKMMTSFGHRICVRCALHCGVRQWLVRDDIEDKVRSGGWKAVRAILKKGWIRIWYLMEEPNLECGLDGERRG